MKNSITTLLCAISFSGFSQLLTHGPIVGGVTDSSCRVFVRTDIPVSVTVEVSNSPLFTTIIASDSAMTNGPAGNIARVSLKGLSANSKYFVRSVINGRASGDKAQFGTFPNAGTSTRQLFLTGSCMSNLSDADSALLKAAINEKANAFIQCGNWGYPDPNGWAEIYFTNPPSSWAKNYANVQNSYLERYASPNSGFFMKSLSLDYVYDDHDFTNEKSGKQEALGYIINIFSGNLGAPENWDMPAQARTNSITGYQQWFPGYDLPNAADGIYHSFRSGNCEFFVLDTRSMRGPDLVSVRKVANVWVYQPVAGSSILGSTQMNWLKSGLSSSTATWKFIVSSVPFNVGARFALDSLVKLGAGLEPYWNPQIQNVTLPRSGFAATNHFTDWWSGFKSDGDSLLSFIFSGNIKNVFVLSGNSGTTGLDDGTNSGLPELNSGNLKILNSQDWLTFQKFMNFNIWNKGGSGLCDENNFNTTYGRIEVFGNDSIRLGAVDANGAEVMGSNFRVNEPYKFNPSYSPNHIPMAANDAGSVANDNTLTIPVTSNDSDPDHDMLFVSIKTNPIHGTAVVTGSNEISYQPAAGYTGADTFYYRACDSYLATCPNCASAYVAIQVTPATAVVELQGEALQINVFPNPADNKLVVEAIHSGGHFKIELLSAIGQKVFAESFSGKAAIDISAVPAGNYVYHIRNSGNELLRIGQLDIIR